MFTSVSGAAHACGKFFMQYLIDEIEAGRIPTNPDRIKTPGMWERTIFGQAGDLGYRESIGDLEKFTHFMVQNEWKPEQLGIFGNWVVEAGVNARLIRPILDSYLRF